MVVCLIVPLSLPLFFIIFTLFSPIWRLPLIPTILISCFTAKHISSYHITSQRNKWQHIINHNTTQYHIEYKCYQGWVPKVCGSSRRSAGCATARTQLMVRTYDTYIQIRYVHCQSMHQNQDQFSSKKQERIFFLVTDFFFEFGFDLLFDLMRSRKRKKYCSVRETEKNSNKFVVSYFIWRGLHHIKSPNIICQTNPKSLKIPMSVTLKNNDSISIIWHINISFTSFSHSSNFVFISFAIPLMFVLHSPSICLIFVLFLFYFSFYFYLCNIPSNIILIFFLFLSYFEGI